MNSCPCSDYVNNNKTSPSLHHIDHHTWKFPIMCLLPDLDESDIFNLIILLYFTTRIPSNGQNCYLHLFCKLHKETFFSSFSSLPITDHHIRPFFSLLIIIFVPLTFTRSRRDSHSLFSKFLVSHSNP